MLSSKTCHGFISCLHYFTFMLQKVMNSMPDQIRISSRCFIALFKYSEWSQVMMHCHKKQVAVSICWKSDTWKNDLVCIIDRINKNTWYKGKLAPASLSFRHFESYNFVLCTSDHIRNIHTDQLLKCSTLSLNALPTCRESIFSSNCPKNITFEPCRHL